MTAKLAPLWRNAHETKCSLLNDGRTKNKTLIQNDDSMELSKFHFRRDLARNVHLADVSVNGKFTDIVVIKEAKRGQSNFDKEIFLSLSLEHKNIVSFIKELHTVPERRNGKITQYLLMEYCGGEASMQVDRAYHREANRRLKKKRSSIVGRIKSAGNLFPQRPKTRYITYHSPGQRKFADYQAISVCS